jgi:hypothetical protein
LALLLLSLTACQAFPPGSTRDDTADPESGSESKADTAVVSGVDTAAQEQAERKRRAPPPRPRELPPRGELGEERLTGLTTNQTWDLLGPPSQVEEEAPATVWTYEVADCRLELFFYFDLESQEQRTLALDLEAASDFVGSRPFCWYTLAKRGRARAASMPQVDSGGGDRDNAQVPTASELAGTDAEDAGDPAENGSSDAAAGEAGTDANAPSQGENAQ